MIPRYSRPEMVSIWSQETKFRIWFEIEAHATEALAELGVVPKEAADALWAWWRTNPEIDVAAIEAAVEMLAAAERPIFYTGGGVINSGPEASRLLRELARMTGVPVTSTTNLQAIGAQQASADAELARATAQARRTDRRPRLSIWTGALAMHK